MTRNIGDNNCITIDIIETSLYHKILDEQGLLTKSKSNMTDTEKKLLFEIDTERYREPDEQYITDRESRVLSQVQMKAWTNRAFDFPNYIQVYNTGLVILTYTTNSLVNRVNDKPAVVTIRYNTNGSINTVEKWFHNGLLFRQPLSGRSKQRVVKTTYKRLELCNID